MEGRFEPGQRITTRGLAEQCGVSVTPVREAVAHLAAERAIEAEPNRWMRIPLLTPAELRDIRVAREGLATERAAAACAPPRCARSPAATARRRAAAWTPTSATRWIG